MKYLGRQPFSVPVASPLVSEEDWRRIWAPKCSRCGAVLDPRDKGAERCLPCAVQLTIDKKKAVQK